MQRADRLRVALLAGTLGQGGAEKQLIYLARELRDADAEVTVLTLTQGEHHESSLSAIGMAPVWVGRHATPIGRLIAIANVLRVQRPHALLAAHFYVNLYVQLASLLRDTLSVGTARSDIELELGANGVWGPWLLRMPTGLLVNSEVARHNAIAHGCRADRVRVLANVIDLASFDDATCSPSVPRAAPGSVVVAAVGSLLPVKRLDRFLRGLAIARARGTPIVGWVVGDGTERRELESLAETLGLLPLGVCFTGRRCDVPAVLRGADILALTSEHEGFPNSILEGMAARLPVVTTDVGDAARVVVHGETGFVVSGDPESIATRFGELASSGDRRRTMGDAGRRRVEAHYAITGLAGRALDALRALAMASRSRQALAALSSAAR